MKPYEIGSASATTPEDCDCWDANTELLCWPCYRDGFDVPNPTAGEK